MFFLASHSRPRAGVFLAVMLVFFSCVLPVLAEEAQQKDVTAGGPGTEKNFFTMTPEEIQALPEPVLKAVADGVVLRRSKESGRLTQESMRLIITGDYEAARKMLWDALAYAPNNSLANSLLAQIYLWQKNDDEAYRVLEQAGRYLVDGDITYGFLERAVAYFQRQPAPRPPEAIISIAPFRGNKECAISFTFDDGPKSVYTMVLPIFDEFGYKATLFVNPGNTAEHPENPYWGSWDEWKDAARRGYDIGNHSMNHRYLTEVPDDILDSEIRLGAEAIREWTGQTPSAFAFPFDQWTDLMLEKSLQYHKAVRVHDYLAGVYDKVFIPVYGGDKFSEQTGRRLIDFAVVKRLWMIPECHAVKTEEVMTFKPITTGFLRDHLGYIKEQEDRIWVDTFSAVYLYLAERKAARVEVLESRTDSIIFRVGHNLDKNIFNVPLTVLVNPAPQKTVQVAAEQNGAAAVAEVTAAGLLAVTVFPGPDPVTVRWE